MVKILLQTLLGLILLAAGFYLTYLSLKGVEERSGAWWVILPALPIIGFGAFLLYRAGKSDASIFTRKVLVPLGGTEQSSESLATTLQKNNTMDQEWGKTNEARNRLKMLQISAEAQKEG